MKVLFKFMMTLLIYAVAINFLTGCKTVDPTTENKTIEKTSSSKTTSTNTLAMTLNHQLNNEKIGIIKKSNYTRITLSSYYVFTIKNKIRKNFKIYLDIITHNLSKHTFTKIIITGYTDNFGTPLANKNLSRTWATNVANYLTADNISRKKVTIKANGNYEPIASNYTFAGRMLNRRVEIDVYQ